VLVVEDETPIRETLCEALAFEGYAVLAARGGREALAHLDESCPDLILLDLMMPDISGWDVLEQRHAQSLCAQAQVVLLSAARTVEATARKHNVRAYLPKPFELDDLLDLVNRLCPPARP
jgi:DNA-binding response OmpR family regulator